MSTKDRKVIFVPGNGDDLPYENWRPEVCYELLKLKCGIVNVRFPDPVKARQQYWLPFLEKMGADKDTILIGVSSGAVAAMRYAETHQLLGSVLVAPCYTDLDDETEKESGYFDKLWDWEAIKQNQQWILQFGSTDDPLIPVAEFRYINQRLDSEYHEFNDKGHFGGDLPELIAALKEKLQ